MHAAAHLKQAAAAQRAVVVLKEDVGDVAIGAAAEQTTTLHAGKQLIRIRRISMLTM